MDTPSIPQKRCTKCGIEFPATVEHFSKAKHYKDGLRSVCRICRRQENNKWSKEHPETRLERNRRWRREHPEKTKSYKRRQRKAYPDRERNYKRRQRQKHADAINEYQRQWRKRHLEKARAQGRIYNHRRRARECVVGGTHTSADVKAQYNRQKGRCYYCQEKVGETYHVEHVVPVSRGGSNGPDNIVIACPQCNTRKFNKLPHEWPEGGRLL